MDCNSDEKTQEESKQWPQFLAVLSGALLAIGCGFHFGWPSPSVLKMKENDLGFPITPDEISYIVMIGPLGYIIGSPLSGYLLDRLGRKNTLLFLSVPQIVSWLLIATSNSVTILCIARFITGIADGALFTSLPAYIGEICEPKVRGVLGATHSMGIMLGVLLFNIHGSYLPIRTAAYVSLSVPALFLITFIWMPESPYYLLIKNRITDARKSLRTLRYMRNVDDELFRISNDVQRQSSEPGRMQDVFCIPTNLKAFFIIIGMRTFQQFSGLSAVGFYAQTIFQQSGGQLQPAESAIICCGIQVLFMIFCSKLIDKYGRKPLFIFSSIATSITLIIVGLYFYLQNCNYDLTYFTWIPITGMIIYNIVVSCGLLVVPNLMAGELLSISVKSKALGVINMYMGLCISVSSKSFTYLDSWFGMHAPFFFYGSCCIVSAFFCYYVVPETKGKTLEEIQQKLKGNRNYIKCDNNTSDVTNIKTLL